jgi:glutamine synthetase
MIAPAALAYQAQLAETICGVEAAGITALDSTRELLTDVCSQTDKLLAGIKALEVCEEAGEPLASLEAMEALRAPADTLEGLVPDDMWPLPTYTEMLFMM